MPGLSPQGRQRSVPPRRNRRHGQVSRLAPVALVSEAGCHGSETFPGRSVPSLKKEKRSGWNLFLFAPTAVSLQRRSRQGRGKRRSMHATVKPPASLRLRGSRLSTAQRHRQVGFSSQTAARSASHRAVPAPPLRLGSATITGGFF